MGRQSAAIPHHFTRNTYTTHHVGHEGGKDEESQDAPGPGGLAEDGVGGVDHGLPQVVGVARDREEPRRDEPCIGLR